MAHGSGHWQCPKHFGSAGLRGRNEFVQSEVHPFLFFQVGFTVGLRHGFTEATHSTCPAHTVGCAGGRSKPRLHGMRSRKPAARTPMSYSEGAAILDEHMARAVLAPAQHYVSCIFFCQLFSP